MSGPSMNHESAMNDATPQPQMEQPLNMIYDSPDSYGNVPQYPTLPCGAVVINHTGNSISTKRRRGRPRKFGPDGNTMTSPQQQQTPNVAVGAQLQQDQPFSEPHQGAQPEPYPLVDGSGSPPFKKSRGRPRGSKNKKQKEASGPISKAFTPHIVNVEAGEDVALKIMAICQNEPKVVCVLSATGAISTVTLHQAATSGGTATYEGRFDILSLSGLFMMTEVSGQKSRKGGLSVALAGPDGSVLGGSVAGLLTAASPSQVIVGSFMQDGQKDVPTNNVDPSAVLPKVNTGAGTSSSPSRGTPSESSGGAASPLNMITGGFSHHISPSMPSLPWK